MMPSRNTGNVIDFCILSEAMKSLPQLTWLRKGSPVSTGTQTAQLNADPGNVQRGQRLESDIDVLDWLGGDGSMVSRKRRAWH
jgi:hypothetical protein